MSIEKEEKVPKEKQLSGSPSDGGISFRQWDKNAQDDLRAIGGEILVNHYMRKEAQMPMWCAPTSTFSWAENQCQEPLHWNDDPENDADGNPIVYDATNQRWLKADKQQIWMEHIVEVSTKSATKVNAAPPKWTASHCSLAWQVQLAANRDEAIKNYCKSHTRKVARTWIDAVKQGLQMRAVLEEKSGAIGDSMADQREEEDFQAGVVAGYPLNQDGKLDKNTNLPAWFEDWEQDGRTIAARVGEEKAENMSILQAASKLRTAQKVYPTVYSTQCAVPFNLLPQEAQTYQAFRQLLEKTFRLFVQENKVTPRKKGKKNVVPTLAAGALRTKRDKICWDCGQKTHQAGDKECRSYGQGNYLPNSVKEMLQRTGREWDPSKANKRKGTKRQFSVKNSAFDPSKVQCKFYKQGKCNNGDNCRFSHSDGKKEIHSPLAS